MRTTLLLALCLAGSLAAQEGYPQSYPGVTKAPKTERPKPIEEPTRPNFDAHFLQADEYLVLEEAFTGGSGWKRAHLCNLLTAATPETKGEAEFFILAGGRKGEKLWSKHYTRTRPVTKEEVKPGVVLYHFDGGTDEQGVYLGPQNRENLLEGDWFVATITDVSTLYKGFVSLGEYKVRPAGLRTVLKPAK